MSLLFSDCYENIESFRMRRRKVFVICEINYFVQLELHFDRITGLGYKQLLLSARLKILL